MFGFLGSESVTRGLWRVRDFCRVDLANPGKAVFHQRHGCCSAAGVGVKRFTDLRAWQACMTYKRAVYELISTSSLATDRNLREQLESSVAGPPAHVAEGYGRFSPPDSARFLVMGRSSLLESQNHLFDAVDRGHITDERRLEMHTLADMALQELTGLLEYLQSPEALRNARRARERRIATRQERLANRPEHRNPEPPNKELEYPTEREHEPRSEKGEA